MGQVRLVLEVRKGQAATVGENWGEGRRERETKIKRDR